MHERVLIRARRARMCVGLRICVFPCFDINHTFFLLRVPGGLPLFFCCCCAAMSALPGSGGGGGSCSSVAAAAAAAAVRNSITCVRCVVSVCTRVCILCVCACVCV